MTAARIADILARIAERAARTERDARPAVAWTPNGSGLPIEWHGAR